LESIGNGPAAADLSDSTGLELVSCRINEINFDAGNRFSKREDYRRVDLRQCIIE
jgi:hypothetical protein